MVQSRRAGLGDRERGRERESDQKGEKEKVMSIFCSFAISYKYLLLVAITVAFLSFSDF